MALKKNSDNTEVPLPSSVPANIKNGMVSCALPITQQQTASNGCWKIDNGVITSLYQGNTSTQLTLTFINGVLHLCNKQLGTSKVYNVAIMYEEL